MLGSWLTKETKLTFSAKREMSDLDSALSLSKALAASHLFTKITSSAKPMRALVLRTFTCPQSSSATSPPV